MRPCTIASRPIEAVVNRSVRSLTSLIGPAGAATAGIGLPLRQFAGLVALHEADGYDRIRRPLSRYLALVWESQLGADIPCPPPSRRAGRRSGALGRGPHGLSRFSSREMVEERATGAAAARARAASP